MRFIKNGLLVLATASCAILFPLVNNSSFAATVSASLDKNQYSVDEAASPWVVVNKTRPLTPVTYIPKNLVTPRFDDGAGVNPKAQSLAKPAAKALKAMATAMRANGSGTLYLSSGYRSYVSQVAIHDRMVGRYGMEKGEAVAARPGFSEHQTGLAADLGAVGQGCLAYPCFAKTSAGKWLAANSWKYGWVLRYPLGLTGITGYNYEPWHFRYVGADLSTDMHANGWKTLERYFGLPDSPGY